MGVIQRQSIKQSLVNFLGVGIGAISTILIYPYDKEAYGLVRFILDTGLLMAAFITLGAGTISIRFFEEFRENSENRRGFLGFLLLMTAGGSIIFGLLAFVFKEQILAFYSDSSLLFAQFLQYVLPISLLLAFISVLVSYSVNSRRIVVPAIFRNLIKISLPILFLLLLAGDISLQGMANGVVVNYILVLLGLIIYLYYLKSFNWKVDFSFLTSERLGRIGNFALFGLLAQIGSLLALRIDSIMIPTLIDFKSNGVYAIAAFIGNSIMIPGAALIQISSPIIAKSLREGDLAHVDQIYKKASITLSLVGLLFLVAVVSSVEDLFSIMPKSDEFVGGFTIVLLLCSSKVIDLATSVNNQIIAYSKHYRFGMYAVLVMGVLNIVFNLLFIPKFGIIGAALATFVSLLVYNGIKLIFIYSKFGIQPFSKNILVLIFLAALSYIAGMFFPTTGIVLLDIVLRSLLIALIYIPAALYLKISPDINQLLLSGWNKFKALF